MNVPRRLFVRQLLAFVASATVAGTLLAQRPESAGRRWVTAWATAPLAEVPGKDTPPLRGATLRQVVRVTAGGPALRVRLGNYFGAEPVKIGAARVRLAAPAPASASGAWQTLHFAGSREASISPHGAVASDPLALPVPAGANLTVELFVTELPATLTGHSAARATSYVFSGRPATDAPAQPLATFTRWYFLSAVDVQSETAAAIAVLGDSIADGYGCPPDSYTRWPDVLARRLQANPATAGLAVVNVSIGGNRLLRDGLGPRALSRVDRDVFGQFGVSALVLCLGINDIGTRLEARKHHEPYASAADIIDALRQLAQRARERGLKVIGATLTPYAGAGFYWSEDGEADRQAVNRWIRTSDRFDAVIDFDAALRDPRAPQRLAAGFDSGDHLHPSVAGYARMGEVVELSVFSGPAAPPSAPPAPVRRP